VRLRLIGSLGWRVEYVRTQLQRRWREQCETPGPGPRMRLRMDRPGRGRRTPPPAPARDGDPSDTSDGNKPIRRRALGRRTSTSPRARLVWLDPGPAHPRFRGRRRRRVRPAPAPPPISCSGCRPAGTAPPPCWWIIHGPQPRAWLLILGPAFPNRLDRPGRLNSLPKLDWIL